MAALGSVGTDTDKGLKTSSGSFLLPEEFGRVIVRAPYFDTTNIGNPTLASNGSHAKFKTVVLAVATVVAISTPVFAEVGICVKRSELPALEARLFQTELMVAALTCKRRQGYNKIIEKFGDELVARGHALRKTFKRLHGADADKHLNRFITRLANEASLRSLQTTGYCNTVVDLFEQALALQPGALTAFASLQSFSNRHGLAVCEGDTQISRAK